MVKYSILPRASIRERTLRDEDKYLSLDQSFFECSEANKVRTLNEMGDEERLGMHKNEMLQSFILGSLELCKPRFQGLQVPCSREALVKHGCDIPHTRAPSTLQ